MIKKYIKKPVEIRAIQLTNETLVECYSFLKDNVEFSYATDGTFINIKTLEGVMKARLGDVIIS